MARDPTVLAVVATLALAAGPPAAQAAVPAVTDHVVLNEILVTPDGGQAHEAVELHNPTAREVRVDGWRLRDHALDPDDCWPPEGSPGRLSGTMAPGGLRVVDLPNDHGDKTCLNLDEASDLLGLEDAAGAEVDEVCWGGGCAHSDGTWAPTWVPAGETLHRCWAVSGHDEGLADGDRGSVDWDAGEPTLGRPNQVCPR